MKRLFLLFSFFFINLNNLVYADVKELIPCKDSKLFEKKINSSIKKVENRVKLYKIDSNEFKSLLSEISEIKQRFNHYTINSTLCGKDGLPHLSKIQEFLIPSILFLYISGWIGWSGRQYLKYSTKSENSFENEIIINVPIAFLLINSGFFWPINAWKEFIAGDLLANDNEITTSPR